MEVTRMLINGVQYMDINRTRYIKYQPTLYITNLLAKICNYISKTTILEFTRCSTSDQPSNILGIQSTYRRLRDNQSHTYSPLEQFILEDFEHPPIYLHNFYHAISMGSLRMLKIHNNNLLQKL